MELRIASFILVIFWSIDGAAATLALEGPPRGSNGAAENPTLPGEPLTEPGAEPEVELVLEPFEDAELGSDDGGRVDGGGYRETGRDWAFGVGADAEEVLVNVRVK